MILPHGGHPCLLAGVTAFLFGIAFLERYLAQASDTSMPIKLTPSRLRDYLACPLQYRLKHLDGFASATIARSPALAFGSSLHAALQTLHQDGSAQIEAHEIPILLRQHWKSGGYTNPEQEEAQFQLGITTLRNYIDKFSEVPGVILGTELYLSRLIAHEGLRFELGCRADRLELHLDGTLEVLDYKTSANGEVPSEESLLNDTATFIYYLSIVTTSCMVFCPISNWAIAHDIVHGFDRIQAKVSAPALSNGKLWFGYESNPHLTRADAKNRFVAGRYQW